MQTITYSEACDNLKSVMDKAVASRAPVLITRRRGGHVVMMSAEEWAGIKETLHLMSSPANAKRLMDGIARLDAGKARSTSCSARSGGAGCGRELEGTYPKLLRFTGVVEAMRVG